MRRKVDNLHRPERWRRHVAGRRVGQQRGEGPFWGNRTRSTDYAGWLNRAESGRLLNPSLMRHSGLRRPAVGTAKPATRIDLPLHGNRRFSHGMKQRQCRIRHLLVLSDHG